MSSLELTKTAVSTATVDALGTLRRTLAALGTDFPDETTRGNRYFSRVSSGGIVEGGNHGWTTGFWTGMQWIAWQLSGDKVFRDAAAGGTADFARRLRAGEDLETHDLGFLYTLSSVAAWRETRDQDARAVSLQAAEYLMTRFLEPAGIVQAWGDLADPEQRGRTIIDSLMNMPLLTWAYQQSGDARFAEAVRRHSEQLAAHIIRPDNSTFHTFFWDLDSGAPQRGTTAQGAFDQSCWSRGQAWGIYGFALNARAVGASAIKAGIENAQVVDPSLLNAARRCADYFLDHLPADLIPYWDLVYIDDAEGQPRDSSAASIAVCGLIELAGIETNADNAGRYERAARDILASLIANYAPQPPDSADALILHGVYHYHAGKGIDEGSLWGDYFYLEALARVADPRWQPPW